MPFVTTPRGKFFYQEHGSIGPVIYLLHGLTARSQDWGGIQDILAKVGFHVLAFDMKGHGQTDKPESGYSTEDHAKDIEACAKALGHTRVHLVGHSTGGRNALVCAALFPDLTWTLTIIDQTLTADPKAWEKYAVRFKEFPTPFKNEEALDKFVMKKAKKDMGAFHFFKGQYWKKDDGTWDWNYSTQAVVETQKWGRAKEAYDWLPQVKCPALFIKGGLSEYVSMEEAERIEKGLPNGRVIIVPNAGHAVFRDDAEGFLRVLVPFLLRESQGKLFVPED